MFRGDCIADPGRVAEVGLMGTAEHAGFCWRNTSIGVVILSVIACIPERKLCLESPNCVGSSLVTVIPKSTHSRTYFWARRGRNCALTYLKQLLECKFSLDWWLLLVGSLNRCLSWCWWDTVFYGPLVTSVLNVGAKGQQAVGASSILLHSEDLKAYFL